MSKTTCDLCWWPTSQDAEYGDDYCAFHNRLMRWWSDSYGTEVYEMEGRWFAAFLSGMRDRLRPTLILQTLYAIRYGGPWDFGPYRSVRRWLCRTFGHRWPVCVATSQEPDETGRNWWLYRCERCLGTASLPDGNRSTARFAKEVSYNTIWFGFRPLIDKDRTA